MHINRLVDEVLSEPAIELLNALAAHAVVSGQQPSSLFFFPVEPDAWNSTMLLLREIFEAEVLISGDDDWLGFRILQSFGVKHGQLACQFTPTFAEALR